MIGKNLNILVGGGDAKRHDGYVKAFKDRFANGSKAPHKVLGRQRMLHACRADGTEVCVSLSNFANIVACTLQ